ncbi:MAG TPA: lamin tail domain-containing protein [Chryseosolibacter sp.]|nr:lamin tail domain-containing protein [Chryseosolibacter sp.]
MFVSIIKSVASPLIVASLIIVACGDDDGPRVISENVFINEVYAASGDDWVELYNASAESKELSGYAIYDDDPAHRYELPAGTTIGGNSFLLIFCDGTATGLHTGFQLAATGETITLENAQGKIIDQVEFPVLADGQAYGRFPDGSAKLGLSGTATQGTPNGDNQSSVVTNVSRVPVVPGLSDPVTVRAEVLSNSGISTVKLFYRINGAGFQQVAMTVSAGFYQATIPAVNTTGTVSYYIAATNSFGTTTLHPFNAPNGTHEYLLNTDPLPSLRINEFMASNASCCPDNDGGVQEFDDWIEIHNTGPTEVDIAGMYLSDDNANPFRNRIPDSDPSLTTIAPGGFLILWADEDGDQGPLHLNFRLSGDGEDIGLFYIDGRTIDSYTYGAQQTDKSFGLTVDGGTTWQTFAVPTPGSSND